MIECHISIKVEMMKNMKHLAESLFPFHQGNLLLSLVLMVLENLHLHVI
ncbi:hypothetical protein HMPREF0908_0747 [Selenomonas flueggei ATCC 43531]|uniref:Uncharacterized protein n=1 Tax=Selenomonas flueggei ATCC 43531 TaxID=638302 RepID=C4V2K3_9FIRM|nr:hypothetical protein HMPREF0908_0747 [Selenomonas flueggei ATCC 43531]